jgi:hypothetical protein
VNYLWPLTVTTALRGKAAARPSAEQRARERIAAEQAAASAEARRRILVTGAVPLLAIANLYVIAGAPYNPQVLAGLSATQIAARLRGPSSPVAQVIGASTQVIINQINQVLRDRATQSRAR